MISASPPDSGGGGGNLMAPSIVKNLEDCQVVIGEAGKFTCVIESDPLPVVCWYNPSDEQIKESRQFTMLEEKDKTCSNVYRFMLVITRSSPDNEGCYVYEASNPHGSVKSSANLYVQNAEDQLDATDTTTTTSEVAPEKESIDVKKEALDNYYTLKEEIGRGKFGVVYKCIENSTGELRAAKISKCRSQSQRKINENEIDILNSLNHPLIIKVFAAFDHNRQFVTVLELVSGGELFERLMEDELISEMDVIFYIEQVLNAIEYMHCQGILHLDLKPENILLVTKHSTQIKLIDFSVSCRSEQGSNIKVLCGTRQFNPPELINYDPVSPATDMWSVGVIAYVLLAGFCPFTGDTDADISSQIVACSWDFNDDVFEDVSNEAKDFISNLLVNEAAGRATSSECLTHPWLQSAKASNTQHSEKKIKTAKYSSFIARRNWKKSIAAIQATNSFLKRIIASDQQTPLIENPSLNGHAEEEELNENPSLNGHNEEEELHGNGTEETTKDLFSSSQINGESEKLSILDACNGTDSDDFAYVKALCETNDVHVTIKVAQQITYSTSTSLGVLDQPGVNMKPDYDQYFHNT